MPLSSLQARDPITERCAADCRKIPPTAGHRQSEAFLRSFGASGLATSCMANAADKEGAVHDFRSSMPLFPDLLGRQDERVPVDVLEDR